jgi:hypothetical protein
MGRETVPCAGSRFRYQGARGAVFAALLLGCGGDATDGAHVPGPSSAWELPSSEEPANEMAAAAGAAAGEGTTGSPIATQQAEGTPLCGSSFRACGGLLAGSWMVEDTCQEAALSPRAMQLWGETVLNLDARACQGAVQSVTSRWSGRVSFQAGVATDERQRSETVRMNLTRDCLNATFNVEISETKLASVCESLGNAQRSCSSAAGACQCSASSERSSDASGTYGVLDNSFVIGSGSGDNQFFDYCVDGDLLYWREQGSPQRLVLRREPASALEGIPSPNIR